MVREAYIQGVATRKMDALAVEPMLDESTESLRHRLLCIQDKLSLAVGKIKGLTKRYKQGAI